MMKKWLAAALSLKLVLMITPAQAASNAVIFIYHHFGMDRYPSTNVSLPLFEQQLAFLDQQGYHVWPLEKIVQALGNGKPLPEKTVAITIDDAYRSVYEEAYPRLRKYGWPFTVFVTTEGVDRGLSAYMSWEQMERMSRHGATFANHSTSHDYLIQRQPGEDEAAWLQRVRGDILHAQQRLEAELEDVPRLFAYPYGEYNAALAELVEELDFVGFGQQSGAVGPLSDFRALPRFPVTDYYGRLDQFRTKAASLALPVRDSRPWDPVLPDTTRPRLEITLDRKLKRAGELTCYASGQGRAPVQWLADTRFAVQAKQPLPSGRSRYNCTAPATDTGRYYWFSQLWIRPASEGNETP